MPGLFSRFKIWNPSEDLSASDLNGEFNNFLANIDATHAEGYSVNLSQMQTTEDPGDLGSENLTQPISTAQEIQRIRYMLDLIIGKDQWYQDPSASLEDLNLVLNADPSRIVSAKTTTLTKQLNMLLPADASGITLDAVPVNFNCYINGSFLSVVANINSGALNAAPAANNTALLTSSFGGTQASTGVTEFAIGTVGTEISNRNGELCCFKINNGIDDEYFLGTPQSGFIKGIRRGFMFDNTGTNIPAVTLTTGHTITLQLITYVLLKNDSTLQVTYNPPVYSPTAPSTPANGDYWYDTINKKWLVYSAGSFVDANTVYLGVCAQDSAGSTNVARSADVFGLFDDQQNIEFNEVTANTVSMDFVPYGQLTSVYGTLAKSLNSLRTVTMPTDLIPGEIEQASTTYYIYMDQFQSIYFSSAIPQNRPDLDGYYHPAESLRLIGSIYNDSGSNFVASTLTVGPSASGVFEELIWNYNGNLINLTLPQSEVDGYRPVEYTCEIVNIYCSARVDASAGDDYVEVDILSHDYSSVQYQAGTSIFSTLPRINSSTTEAVRAVDLLGKYPTSGVGVVPVLAFSQLNGGTGLSMTLNAKGANIITLEDLVVKVLLRRL